MIGWLILAVGCGGGGGSYECSEEVACAFGETCVDGRCEAPSCNTSSQCPMEYYCSSDRSCEPGCEGESDCYPGFSCNLDEQVCEKEACEETAVDCGYREFCNTGTGDCYDAGDQYCRSCTEDNQCGDGNICWAGYCGVDCTYNDCPGGFTCFPVDPNGNITSTDLGNVVGYQCLTYCWLYEDTESGARTVDDDGRSAPWPAPPANATLAPPTPAL
jgi:hypothetical protein